MQHFEIDGILRQVNVSHDAAADETVVHRGLQSAHKEAKRGEQARQPDRSRERRGAAAAFSIARIYTLLASHCFPLLAWRAGFAAVAVCSPLLLLLLVSADEVWMLLLFVYGEVFQFDIEILIN